MPLPDQTDGTHGFWLLSQHAKSQHARKASTLYVNQRSQGISRSHAGDLKLNMMLSESRKSWVGDALSFTFQSTLLTQTLHLFNTSHLFSSYPASFRSLFLPSSITFVFSTSKSCTYSVATSLGIRVGKREELTASNPPSRCLVSLSIAINSEIQSLEDHSTRLPSFLSSISSHRSWKHHSVSPALPSRALYHQRAIATRSWIVANRDSQKCALNVASSQHCSIHNQLSTPRLGPLSIN